MKIILMILTLLIVGCKQDKEPKISSKTIDKNEISSTIKIEPKPYKISFDEKLVSEYTIESREEVKSKAIVKQLSEYPSKELQALPFFKRLTLAIVVPFDISKESLKNTMKSIVDRESKLNIDIDEIMIFAYDDKEDLNNGGGFYTFGKLFWGPNGKMGNVNPTIAEKNIRTSYECEIVIKEKVGEIKKSDLPTKRKLAIYNSIMSEENIGLDEDVLNKKVMKKFNIKTAKELNAIWLKVAAYKD